MTDLSTHGLMVTITILLLLFLLLHLLILKAGICSLVPTCLTSFQITIGKRNKNHYINPFTYIHTVCTHVHTHTHTYTHTRTHTLTCMHTHVHHTHTHKQTHTYPVAFSFC